MSDLTYADRVFTGTFTSCQEVMISMYTRLQDLFEERHEDENTDFRFLFDSISGAFLVTALIDGEEVEEIFDLAHVGHFNRKTKTFQKVTEEEVLVSGQSDDTSEDFYDFMSGALDLL